MKKSTTNRTKIDPNFKVSEGIRIWVGINQMPDPDQQLEAFIDHHAALGNLMADWDAAFRTWLRNAKKWGIAVTKVAPPSKQPIPAPVRAEFPPEEKTNPEDLKIMMGQLNEILSKVGNGPATSKPTQDEAERKQKLLEQARKLGVKI